jgi:uncharacterized protein YjbI with pentapeptide repeats
MANQQHVSLLKKGAEIWNQWRTDFPEQRPDLSGADLSELKLAGINLRGANLNGSKFSFADLNKADLRLSCISNADFTGVFLIGANLSGAMIDKTDLSRAIMREVTLTDEYFHVNDLSSVYLDDGAEEQLKHASSQDDKDVWDSTVRANLAGLTHAELDHLKGSCYQRATLTESNLEQAEIQRSNLRNANLRGASLVGADFSESDLSFADLSHTDLRVARFRGANLQRIDLSGADLSYANLDSANLSFANLSDANLNDARLVSTILIETNVNGAQFSNCNIYGISAWNLKGEPKVQSNLIITSDNDPKITVDNLEVAQFIYLLINNSKIRHVIDTLTSKVVLLLGRFTPERKAILDGLREALRKQDFLPVLFDFEKPGSRDIHETVTTLARLARFVIADITDPKSIPQELVSIVESMPSLPIQPLIQAGCEPWGMYDHIKRYPWVLELREYKNLDDLLTSIKDRVIAPAATKSMELKR